MKSDPQGQQDVLIIGGGIVGVATAALLAEAGRQVLVIDRTAICEETSSGNAAALAFSDILPLASKGVMRKVPGWLMDPLGLAMENFDGIGGWRARDAGVTIDATSQLSDGTGVNGIVELRAALLRRPEVFVRTLTENLMVYALGRGLDAADMPTVRAVMRDARPGGYRFGALVNGIVNSTPFRMRTAAAIKETE